MRHDELLANISSNNFIESRTLQTPYSALRAVVELHKPYKIPEWFMPRETEYTCERCSGYYPCLTIQTIEKELS